MNCNCTCNNFYYVTGATITSGQLVLTFNKTPSIDSTDRICFRLSQGVTFPSGYESLPVAANIVIDGLVEPVVLWNKYGNEMIGSELAVNSTNGACCRATYKGFVGSQTTDTTTTYHILVTNIPKPTMHCC